MPNRHGKETDMKLRINDYEVTMDSGRVYSAAELFTPNPLIGKRKEFDTLAVFYNGIVDEDDDPIECTFEMVDWEFGVSDMTADDIWTFLIETAEVDDKWREEEENRK